MSSNRWRPIATAPKDGTYVLLYRPGWVYVEDRVVGFWSARWKGWMNRPDTGWPGATHWRPLPAPPKETRHA